MSRPVNFVPLESMLARAKPPPPPVRLTSSASASSCAGVGGVRNLEDRGEWGTHDVAVAEGAALHVREAGDQWVRWD